MSGGSAAAEVAKKPRKQLIHAHEVQDVPLPEGIVDRLQANNWSERHEAITELEGYITSTTPQSLSPQLQRV